MKTMYMLDTPVLIMMGILLGAPLAGQWIKKYTVITHSIVNMFIDFVLELSLRIPIINLLFAAADSIVFYVCRLFCFYTSQCLILCNRIGHEVANAATLCTLQSL